MSWPSQKWMVSLSGLMVGLLWLANPAQAETIVLSAKVNIYDVGKEASLPKPGDVSIDVVRSENPAVVIGTNEADKNGCWSVGAIDSSYQVSIQANWQGSEPKYQTRDTPSDKATGFVANCEKARLIQLFHPVRLVGELLGRAWYFADPVVYVAKGSACWPKGTLDRAVCFSSVPGSQVIDTNIAAIKNARVFWERAFSLGQQTDLSSSKINIPNEIAKRARFEMDIGAVCQASQLFSSMKVYSPLLESYRGEISVQWLESAYACLSLGRSDPGSLLITRIVVLHGLAKSLLEQRSANDLVAIARLLQVWLLSYEIAAKDKSVEEMAIAIKGNTELEATWQSFRAIYGQYIESIYDGAGPVELAKVMHNAFVRLAK